MEKVVVKVPGSCGELIQGFYGGPECLISYAIDCYSTVTMKKSEHYQLCINHNNEKAVEAYKRACSLFDLDSENYQIDIQSEIPIGKGMASSTADIVGVLTAVAKMAGVAVNPAWIGKRAAEIEPTDNIMYEDWVLFDHLKGEKIEVFKSIGNLSVIVLEMEAVIDTKALRHSGAFSKDDKPNPSNALNLLKEAIEEVNLDKLGQAMSLSALENQIILKKPYLEELIELANNFDVVGVNAAHSGSVLGIVFKTGHYPEEYMRQAELKGLLTPYTKRYIHKIIKGGPLIEVF